MSRFLRDSAERNFLKASQLLQKEKYKEALVELQKAEEAAQTAKAIDIFLHVQNTKGRLMQNLGAYEEALKICFLILKTTEELLSKDPDNELYQSIFWTNFGDINTLGNLFYNAGHFIQAKKCYELHLSISQKLQKTSPENLVYQSNVAVMLNNLGALLSDMGRIEEAKQRYEKALEIREKLLKTDPENVAYQSAVAMTLNNFGLLLKNMGRIEEAKQRLDKALVIYEKLLQMDPENVVYQSDFGMALNNLGNLLLDTGRIEESKQRYEKALEIRENLLKTNPKNIAYQLDIEKTLNNLGNLLRSMGRIEEAKQRLEKAFEISENLLKTNPKNIAYQLDIGKTLNNLGALLYAMGHFEESKQRYEKALKIYEELLKTDPENVVYQTYIGMMLTNLGALLTDMGRIEEAKQRYEKALEMREKLLKKDPENVLYQSNVGGTLNNLGNLLSAMDRIEEAKQRYEKALEIREKLLETDTENVVYQSDVGGTLNNFGNLLRRMGRIEEAKQMYKRSLEISEKLLKTDSENVAYQTDVGGNLNNFGLMLLDMGRFEEAKQRFKKALEIYEELLKKDSENIAYKLCIGKTLNNLGALFLNMGRFKESKQKYEKTLEIWEKLLKTDTENVVYRSYIGKTLNNLGNLSYKQESYSIAIDLHLKALKDYALMSANLDLLFRVYASIGRCYEKLGNFDSAFNNYKKSIECIESIRSQYSIEEIKMDIMWNKGTPYNDMISFLCTSMNDSEKAWDYVGRFKSRTLLELLRFVDFETPKNLPSELLAQEENLLISIRAFDMLRRKTEKTDKVARLTWKIKEKESELNVVYDRIREFSPEYVDLKKGQPLEINEIKELIETQNKKIAFVEYYTTDEKLFIFVMNSDEKSAKVEIVDLSSNELFNYLNRYYMEIVDIPDTVETWQELSRKLIEPIFNYIDGCELVYLIPHGLLHYLPLHALLVNDKLFGKKKRLIEYFPIVYLPNLTVLKYAQRRNSQCLNPCISLGYTPYDFQKELFEGEAKLVAEQFDVEPILGDRAISEVLNNISSDVIHASCHGGFNSLEPLNSGLCLKDGILTARKIFEMNIKTNLLVLSACQTGLNSQKPGDDLVGLTRAFLYAGARSLVVSLWSINAGSTYEYMRNFYKEIREGKDKAKALQKIQIDFINGKYGDIYSHPYFWAPFTLIGDWK